MKQQEFRDFGFSVAPADMKRFSCRQLDTETSPDWMLPSSSGWMGSYFYRLSERAKYSKTISFG